MRETVQSFNKLFYEFIRVAIRTQDSLSRSPSSREWGELYAMAKKQSLVGICFAGIQRLGGDPIDGYARIGMSERQYLVWMGVAAKIQQRNEVVDGQCVELQARLADAGIRSCVLKGQGVAALYRVFSKGSKSQGSMGFNNGTSETIDLSHLRQSGDIDIYVNCGRERAIRYAKSMQRQVDWDYKHLHLNVFEDTEVEMHYRPEYLANLWHNRKLQKWFSANQEHAFGRKMKIGAGEITTPDTAFNSLYVLIHIYNHNFRAGVGLRQLMDFFFVISERVMTDEEKKDLRLMLCKLGMEKYASGIMWIMRDVFGMKEEYLVCSVNEDEGRYILDGVMIGGNMGHGYNHSDKNLPFALRFVSSTMRYMCRSFGRYPLEAISYPIWTAYHFIWKRIYAIIHRI